MKGHRFLIISEPRTGSNNLSYCLGAHPDLVVGNELLHPDNGVRPAQYGLDDSIARADGYPRYHWIDRVGQDVRNRVLTDLFESHNGFKIHTQHLPVVLIAAIVHDFDCRVVLPRRVSLFDQALSNYVATARNCWHADEAPDRAADMQPFDIPQQHFLQWVEGILAVRKSLWQRLRSQAARVIPVEYESFYAGAREARIARVNELYRLLGLKTLDACDEPARSATLVRLDHYLDSSRQKLAVAGLAESLVRNYAEIQQLYAFWVMRSWDTLADA